MKRSGYYMAGLWLLAALMFPLCYADQTSGPQTVQQLYPNLASGVLTYAKVGSVPDGVLLVSGNVAVSAADVEKTISAQPEQLRAELKKNAFFVLEQKATGELLKKAAAQELSEGAKDGSSSDDNRLVQTFIGELTKGVSVTDDDVETFYRENENVFGGLPLASVRKHIENYVLQDKQQRVVDRYIQTLGQRVEIVVSDAWTKQQAENAKDNPLDKARVAGKPTLAIFSAASCCGPDKMLPVSEALRRRYDTRINIIYIEPSKEQILSARYGIRAIPTEIIFDSSGKEFYRHSGFLSEEDIIGKLKETGAQ